METERLYSTLEEKAQELVKKAMTVFMRQGIKAVNMADLAKAIGVSKKTLYKYIKDKRELIRLGMDQHCTELSDVMERAQSDGDNAIESELLIMKEVQEMVSGMHPSVLFDLQKYHPKAYRALLEKRDAMLLGTVESNIRRGQEEGVYKKNVHPVVAARFLVSISNAVNDLAQENSTGTSVSQLHMQSVHYHIHAISSPKGVQYFTDKMASEFPTNP
ncbi:MAG: TetR/AcrR family transcriptional regulator [Flavobacteriales bacterium]